MLSMVGMTGLEPAASWSRTKRATKLRHIPIFNFSTCYYIIIGGKGLIVKFLFFQVLSLNLNVKNTIYKEIYLATGVYYDIT